MKRILFLTGVIVLLAVAVMASGPAPRPAPQGEEPKPTLVPLEEPTPAPTPADQREVAILTLFIESDGEGKIERIALDRARILKSYAPNVLYRTGPWLVELDIEEESRFFFYGVADPRWQTVYPIEEGEPFQREFATEIVWELVVPLYLFDRDLNPRAINLYDLETGDLIFTTEVDRVKWK